MIVDITCFNCGHPWETDTLTDPDPYLCHNCGLNNMTKKYEPKKLEAWKKSQMKEEKIPGGLAKGMSLVDIAKHHKMPVKSLQKKLEQGIKTEMEHTTDKAVAREIAMDHIYEDPNYYSKLKKLETEGTCGYNEDVETGEIFDTPGGLGEGDKKGIDAYSLELQKGLEEAILDGLLNEKDPKTGTGKKLDTPVGLEEENLISETMTVYRLGEIPYDEESFFVTPDYKTWIKFYPGEEIHKITTNKLYLPLRNKSFSSWDELRSKYNSGEFTDDDVSYINPEESGIQNFEQYEIKPDDIIDLEQINLREGRKKKPDPKTGTGKKPKGSGRRLYTDEDPSDTVKVKFSTKQDIIDTLSKASFKSKSHARQSQIINLIHQRVRAAYERAKDPDVKRRLKTALDYAEQRKEASKEKTQRLKKLKEGEGGADTSWTGIDNETITLQDILELTKDIKIQNFPTKELASIVLNWDNNPEEIERISQVEVSSQYPVLIMVDEQGKIQWILDGNHRAKKALSAKAETIPAKLIKPSNLNSKARKILLGIVDERLKQLKEVKGSAIPYGSGYKKLIPEITKFMLDKGMNIKPLPVVKFIEDDEENAKNILGRTAFYNPNEKSISLYTLGRHPKDILRSFCHEMIHHMQNVEGRLPKFYTTNTQEDSALNDIEEEAHKLGSMTMREFEDTIKK